MASRIAGSYGPGGRRLPGQLLSHAATLVSWGMFSFISITATELQAGPAVECSLGATELTHIDGFEGARPIRSLDYDFDWSRIEELPATGATPAGMAFGTFEHTSADLNGDGLVDAVVFLAYSLVTTGPPTPIQILFNTGDGSLVDCTADLINGDTPHMSIVRDIHVADFNGDKLPDIFFSNTGSEANDPFVCEQNRLLLSGADGKLTDRTATHLPQLADFSHGSSVADIDGDGDIDIFVTNLGCQSTIGSYMMQNDGAGQFSIIAGGQPQQHAYFSHQGPTWSAFLDFDRDGDQDLFAAAVKILAEGNEEILTNQILINDGLGNFSEQDSVLLPEPFLPLAQDVAIGDLNHDGRTDIVVLYDPAQSPIVQLLMNNDSGFTDETVQRLPDHSAAAGSFPKFTLADLDGNRSPDIIYQGAEAFYFLNDGTGHFSRESPDVNQHFSSLMISLDLNADGILDQVDLVCESGEEFCELNRWYRRFIYLGSE